VGHTAIRRRNCVATAVGQRVYAAQVEKVRIFRFSKCGEAVIGFRPLGCDRAHPSDILRSRRLTEKWDERENQTATHGGLPPSCRPPESVNTGAFIGTNPKAPRPDAHRYCARPFVHGCYETRGLIRLIKPEAAHQVHKPGVIAQGIKIGVHLCVCQNF